jgi:predicted nucleic acid-binding Zn finger protein
MIMVTRHNIIYSIAAAQRILGIKSGVYEIRVWAWVVLVRGLNFCRFMSKKAFLKHFADRRREEGKNIDLVIDDQDDRHFTALGKKNFYQLHTTPIGVNCTCEDYSNQIQFFGKAVCKHGYAVLSHLGFNTLTEYLERDRTCERLPDISQAPVRIPPCGERTSRGRSID